MRLRATLLLAAALALTATSALAKGWQVESLPGAQGACSATLHGAKVDLILMLNNTGKLVLTAGHKTWSVSGDATSTLSVDGGPPQPLKISGVGNLYLGLTSDALTARLRQSHAIDWTLPTGRYHIATTGLAAAMDGVKRCSARG